MSDYSLKIIPICCHAYRVNRVWEEAENRWVNRLTIQPQTFCGLKGIELKTRKIQRKSQQHVTITQTRLATEVRKFRFLSSCQYTHGCYAPASWAARHTTVCLDKKTTVCHAYQINRLG